MRKYVDVTIHNGVFGQPFRAFHINITNYKGENDMTKREFTERFFKKAGLQHKVQAERLVNTFLETIEECVIEDEKVEFTGFGSFFTVDKPETKGKNPRTGEEVIIPAKKVVRFKVGKNFKEIVNK